MTQPSAADPPPPDEYTQAVHFAFLTIALYLLYAGCVSVAFTVLLKTDFYDRYYGHSVVEAATAGGPKNAQQQADSTRLHLWASALAFPCWLIPSALAAWFLPANYRREIGVSLGRFSLGAGGDLVAASKALGLHILLGIGVWLHLAPAVLGVNYLVGWLYKQYIEVTPEEHAFTSAAQSGGMEPVEWGLLAVGVMVSAPLWEELLFRGLLPAVARKLRGSGSHSMMALAFAAALLLRWDPIQRAAHERFLPLLLAAMPPLFVLAMLPLYAVVCRVSRTENGPVVFATALLFGAVHSSVWPTPIALFIFGLGLGWLAFWTRSLVAPVVVHSLFNAVSYGWLLYFR